MIHAFGECELDDDRYVLSVAGEERPIEPQVFEVLLLLLRNRGRVVTKEEILDEVWGDRFVSESALTTRIKAARKAVDDDGTTQAVIRTSHGKGYEFVAEVTTRDTGDAASVVPTSRLPLGLETLIGREEQLHELVDTVSEARLLTLVGPAGVGKTALAYEVARRVEPDFADGAYLCELVEVARPDATPKALATALRINARLDTSIDDTIVEVLRPLDALVVLDNCEHVIETIGPLVGRILRAAPNVTILATSREPLGVAAERTVPVGPLAVENARESNGVEIVPAVALFVERAAAADPAFELDEQTTPAVVEICRRLDGIPLAIELAAARTRSVDVAEIAQRLDERFRLLRSVRREGDRRHHALGDAVKWSYDLLTPEEQTLFTRLSIFTGAFDLDAIEEVCAPAGDQLGDAELDLIDGLSRLVDRSMVSVRRRPGVGTSYELLETLRDFGRELLPTDQLSSLSRRHTDHFVRVASEVERAGSGRHEARSNARAEGAFADLRAAQHSALEAGDLDRAFALITSLREYSMRSMRYEVLTWADRALATPGAEEHKLFPMLLGIQGYAAWIRGEFDEALHLAAGAADVEAQIGVEPSGLPERVVANVRFAQGEYDLGIDAVARQLELAEASGHQSRIVHAAYMHSVASSIRDRDSSRELAERALQVADRTMSPTDQASAWAALGFSADSLDDGIAAFDRADSLAASAGNRWMSTFARAELYGLLVQKGDHDAARQGLADVVDIWLRSGEWSQQWLTLGRCLVALSEIGERQTAAEVAGAVEARSAIGATPVVASLRTLALETAESLERALGADAFEHHRNLGAEMSDVDVVHRARTALLGPRPA